MIEAIEVAKGTTHPNVMDDLPWLLNMVVCKMESPTAELKSYLEEQLHYAKSPSYERYYLVAKS